MRQARLYIWGTFHGGLHALGLLPSLFRSEAQPKLDLEVRRGTQEDDFAPVLRLLDSLSNKSSCFATASKRLLVECDVLTSDLEESRKSRYAIDLTLCELSTAGLTGPPMCRSIDSDQTAILCVRALEDKPQWWTSFSGYFRDVTTMCHVARRGREAEQTLNLYRNLTSATQTLMQLLRQNLREAEELSSRRTDAFMREREFSAQTAETSKATAASAFESFQQLSSALNSRSTQALFHLHDVNDVVMTMVHTFREMSRDSVAFAQQQETEMFDQVRSMYSKTTEYLNEVYKDVSQSFEQQLVGLVSAVSSLQNVPSEVEMVINSLNVLRHTELDAVSTTIVDNQESLQFMLATVTEALQTVHQFHDSIEKAHQHALSLSQELRDTQENLTNLREDTIRSIEVIVLAAVTQVESLKGNLADVEAQVLSWDLYGLSKNWVVLLLACLGFTTISASITRFGLFLACVWVMCGSKAWLSGADEFGLHSFIFSVIPESRIYWAVPLCCSSLFISIYITVRWHTRRKDQGSETRTLSRQAFRFKNLTPEDFEHRYASEEE